MGGPPKKVYRLVGAGNRPPNGRLEAGWRAARERELGDIAARLAAPACVPIV